MVSVGFESRPGASPQSNLRGGRLLCEYCTNKLIKLGPGWLKGFKKIYWVGPCVVFLLNKRRKSRDTVPLKTVPLSPILPVRGISIFFLHFTPNDFQVPTLLLGFSNSYFVAFFGREKIVVVTLLLRASVLLKFYLIM